MAVQVRDQLSHLVDKADSAAGPFVTQSSVWPVPPPPQCHPSETHHHLVVANNQWGQNFAHASLNAYHGTFQDAFAAHRAQQATSLPPRGVALTYNDASSTNASSIDAGRPQSSGCVSASTFGDSLTIFGTTGARSETSSNTSWVSTAKPGSAAGKELIANAKAAADTEDEFAIAPASGDDEANCPLRDLTPLEQIKLYQAFGQARGWKDFKVAETITIDGQIYTNELRDRAMVPAMYLYDYVCQLHAAGGDIRVDIDGTGFVEARPASKMPCVHNDYTAYEPQHQSWTKRRGEGRPEILYQFRCTDGRKPYRSLGKLSFAEALKVPDGTSGVLDGTVLLGADAKIIKAILGLPVTISSAISGWEIEAMSRLDKSLGHPEFRARVAPCLSFRHGHWVDGRLPKTTFNKRRTETRKELRLLNWLPMKTLVKSDRDIVAEMEQHPNGKAQNSTRDLQDASADRQLSYHAAARGTVPSRAGKRQLSAVEWAKSLHSALEVLLESGLAEDSAEIRAKREQIRKHEAGELLSKKEEESLDHQGTEDEGSDDEEQEVSEASYGHQVEPAHAVGMFGMPVMSSIAGAGAQFLDTSQLATAQLHGGHRNAEIDEYDDLFDFGAASNDAFADQSIVTTHGNHIGFAPPSEPTALGPVLLSDASLIPSSVGVGNYQKQSKRRKRQREDLDAGDSADFKHSAKRSATRGIYGMTSGKVSENTSKGVTADMVADASNQAWHLANDHEVAVALQDRLWNGDAQRADSYQVEVQSIRQSDISVAGPLSSTSSGIGRLSNSSKILAGSDADRAEAERVERFRSNFPSSNPQSLDQSQGMNAGLPPSTLNGIEANSLMSPVTSASISQKGAQFDVGSVIDPELQNHSNDSGASEGSPSAATTVTGQDGLLEPFQSKKRGREDPVDDEEDASEARQAKMLKSNETTSRQPGTGSGSGVETISPNHTLIENPFEGIDTASCDR